MKRHLRRMTALLLALIMILGSVASASASTSRSRTAHVYTEAEYEAIDNDVFALINGIKEDALENKTYTEGSSAYLTKEDYVNLVPQVIEAVKASETYVEGTLQQNGYFLVWETTSGIPCCYSPRMEALLSRPSSLSDNEMLAIEAEAEIRIQPIGSGIAKTNVFHSPTSNNIGLIQPYWESNSSYDDSNFCNYSPYYKTMWQNLYAATGGSGVRYSRKNATVDNIARTMEQCGLVIFDSHGTTDYDDGNDDYTSEANSSYLCLTTNSGITSQDTAAQTGPYGTYYNCLKGYNYAYVNGDCIANHMTSNAPGSLLYMGICLGMATDKMFSGLRAKGVEVVYGYSQSVTFDGEKSYMQSILGYVKDGDTFATALSKAKSSLGYWDPAYSSYSQSQAVRNHVAFPIAVSTEDAYPGHGYVDAVQTVYSTWTLYKTYTVNAVSNNTNYGTVSVDGYTITASPKEGYYTSGYQVTSGSAQVVQDGNTFNVTPSSDCTVRINFAAKTRVTVSCFADGSAYQTLTGYANEAITLPSSAPAVDGWTFMGWSSNEVEESSSSPGYYAKGSEIAVASNTSLYAVYRANGGSAPAETVYELVTAVPSDWSGDYVITTSTSADYVMKGLSGDTVSYESTSGGGAVALGSSGIALDGTTLFNVADAYVFTVETNGSYYTIKNEDAGTYLASIGATLKTRTVFDSASCNWTLSMGAAAPIIDNPASSSYRYLSSGNGYFKLHSNTNTPAYLWKSSTASFVYSTIPSEVTLGDDPVTPAVYYTVNFSVPAGVSPVASQTVEEGGSLSLPAAGAPAGYTFLGWVTGACDNASSMPGSVLTGTYTPAGNITLYALYSHTETSASSYELLTAAPSDWSGSYVITYGSGSGLNALTGLSGTTKYESTYVNGYTALSETGMSLSGNRLSGVDDAYVFIAEANGSSITLRNAATGTYLASHREYLYSYPSLSSDKCLWTPSMSGAALTLRNPASSRYSYLSFSTRGYYMLTNGPKYNIYMWKGTESTSSTVYTTVIH